MTDTATTDYFLRLAHAFANDGNALASKVAASRATFAREHSSLTTDQVIERVPWPTTQDDGGNHD